MKKCKQTGVNIHLLCPFAPVASLQNDGSCRLVVWPITGNHLQEDNLMYEKVVVC